MYEEDTRTTIESAQQMLKVLVRENAAEHHAAVRIDTRCYRIITRAQSRRTIASSPPAR